MLENTLENANSYITGHGLERIVSVAAVVGMYTTGKLVVKGIRKAAGMVKTDAKGEK